MPTIKDIAKYAGVSQGTVSNVLNRRGNVSTQKIKLVEDAMKQLGYTANAQAQQLRNNVRTSSSVAVILPNIIDWRYSIFYSDIKLYLEQYGYTAQLFLTNDAPYMEQNAITAIMTQRPAGVIAITCMTHPMPFYQHMINNGGKVVFVERNHCSGGAPFAGYDFTNAGRDLAARVLKENISNVGLFTGLTWFSHERDFKDAFVNSIMEKKPHINIISLECDMLTADKTAYEFFASERPPEIIVTTSGYLANSIGKISWAASAACAPRILTLDFGSNIDLGISYERYYLDYHNLSKAAVSALQHQFNSDEKANETGPKEIVLQPDGFLKIPHVLRQPKRVCLNVMTISGQGAESLKYMAPYYTQQSNVELNIVALPPQAAFDTLLHLGENTYFDILRSNFAITPQLRSDTLIPIDPDVYAEVTRTMIPKVVKILSLSRDAVEYAIPMDLATQMLVYRKDLFEDSLLKRLYYEKTSYLLDIPQNFDEFNSINSFFCKRTNPQSPVAYGSTSALGTGSAVLTNFLLRYREQGGNILAENNHILMDRGKMLQAVKKYSDAVFFSTISHDPVWWDVNVNNIVAGNTAMELFSVNYAANLVDFRKSQIEGRLGYARVPGGTHGLGGGSFVVSSKCREQSAAMDFLRWFCGNEQAEAFTYLGGTSPHAYVYEKSRILQLYPWYDNFLDTVENNADNVDWLRLNRYRMELLFGRTLCNVFHGIISCEESVDLLLSKIDSCLPGAF